MKKINLKSMREESFGKLNAESMKKILGGYTLPTVTVTPAVTMLNSVTPVTPVDPVDPPVVTPSITTGPDDESESDGITDD